MKVLAVFLGIFCMFSSALPCCTDDCDTTQEEHSTQTDHKEGAGELCSPFLSCGVCAGFVPVVQQPEELAPLQVPIYSRAFRTPVQFITSDYIHKVWQPPKQVIIHT